MSKREGTPALPEAPDAKKPRLETDTSSGSVAQEQPAQVSRPDSPIAGPSSAPSDPQLQVTATGLIPVYRYFDPRMLEESSSQGSISITDIGTTTASTTDTTSSTNVEVGDSRCASIEDMDIDSDADTSESSDFTDRRRRYRKHRSRRDK